ncbi:hypothetical protein EWM64_g6200 [Hericium alpestre]|uniref:Uncharacterized protein n=1 Tax=Hericium alpestre TaxID=135208 RepID=A0A4Y9ZVA9_9AGAM|nr:hypothetical protein EWM64_g6200 [Hericium alpestre]
MADPNRVHKRKRILQDSPVDLTKMRMAMNRLGALEEELEGIEETEEELKALMLHVDAPEAILGTAKKPKLSFSSASDKDIDKIGVIQKRLVFSQQGIDQLVAAMSEHAIQESKILHERIKEVYEFVNMDFEPGSRMLLDAVLLRLGKITGKTEQKGRVAVMPEMRLGAADGVQITNPLTQYEVWLTGSVDYAILKYVDEYDNKARLFGLHTNRKFVLEIAKGRLFLVEAKSLEASLDDYLPEAITQAIALSKLSGQNRVHFCLSNGQSWIFCLLDKDANSDKWTSYESVSRTISQDSTELAIREIFQLMLEWLEPTGSPALYTLLN